MKKGVIFDLDGTLLDSLTDIADSANAVLNGLSFAVHPVDAYRRFVGDGVAVLFQRALPPESLTEALVAECVARMRDEYGQRWNNSTRPYDGILELIQELKWKGLRLGVLSNKPQAFSRKCTDEFFPPATFDLVLGQREGVPRKPDPAGACEIALELRIERGECLFVGDSSIDMETARRAEMMPIGVEWGFRDREELIRSGAASVISRPEQLLEFIGLSGPTTRTS